MKNIRTVLIPLALLGAFAASAAPNAVARDQLDWSLSIGSQGGGYYAPAPVYAPPPVVVYRQPPPVIYAAPPVVYAPRTVYPMVGPGVVYTQPGYAYGYRDEYRGRRWHGHGHGHGWGHDRD